MIDEKYQYYAFISYKREDEQWAKWLQNKLEHYKLPTNLNDHADLPKGISPVFKDTSELTPGNLPHQLQEALKLSKYLIVVCSPRSAKSEWVNKEVETFKSMGRVENIIPFIIDGQPYSQDESDECFPQAIINLPKEQELLGVNINALGREAALVKTVARMFDIRFDELWQRHEREQKKRRHFMMALAASLILVVSGVAFWMYLQRQETLKANWAMMENQARMVSEKSKELVKQGNTYDAILALLELLPEDGSRPFVPELEEALRVAYDSLISNKWNYRYFDEKYSVEFAANDKDLICKSDSIVAIYETKTLRKQFEFEFPDKLNKLPYFLSVNNDSLYIMDTLSVICYHLPDVKFIKKMTYTDAVLDLCMDSCADGIYYKEWPWIEKWKQRYGIPANAILMIYNPQKKVVLYKQPIPELDNDFIYECIIYDCVSKKIIKIIDDDGKPFDLFEGEDVTSFSFSPDGNKLALAYRNGTGTIIDLNDLSSTLFKSKDYEFHQHYSNWLIFSLNGQLLQGSMWNNVNIYNGQTLELEDSIIPVNSILTDGTYAILNKKGNVCLLTDSENSFLYYRNDIPSKTSDESGFKILDKLKDIYPDTIINQRFHFYEDNDGGIHMEDLKGEYPKWQRNDKQLALTIMGFIHDNKYLVVIKEGFRDSQHGIEVIDLATGVTVYRTSPNYYLERAYYNQDSEELAFGGENGVIVETAVPFPTFEKIKSICKKEVEGMQLTRDAKKKLYLSTTEE